MCLYLIMHISKVRSAKLEFLFYIYNTTLRYKDKVS